MLNSEDGLAQPSTESVGGVPPQNISVVFYFFLALLSSQSSSKTAPSQTHIPSFFFTICWAENSSVTSKLSPFVIYGELSLEFS